MSVFYTPRLTWRRHFCVFLGVAFCCSLKIGDGSIIAEPMVLIWILGTISQFRLLNSWKQIVNDFQPINRAAYAKLTASVSLQDWPKMSDKDVYAEWLDAETEAMRVHGHA